MLPDLLSYIEVTRRNQVLFNDDLMQIYNGSLLRYVEESMQQELSPRAFNRSKGRIAPINILTKIVEKLSQVYTEAPCRDAGDNEIDAQLVEYYEDELELNTVMALGNELLNLHKHFAIELYLNDEGEPQIRLLPANTYIVYSDNEIDPTDVTVFIKLMGKVKKLAAPETDQYGRVMKSSMQRFIELDKYYIYSDNEFMIIDSSGEIYSEQENPYGVMPFVYCNSSQFELIPTPDASMKSMSVLIPKLISDLNYSSLFSRGIIYGINCEITNMEANPDSFLSINSPEGSTQTPSVGTIKPETDSDKNLNLIHSQLSMFLDSKGIRPGSIGTLDTANVSSGIAKMIDNADASSTIKKHKNMFIDFESDLWDLIITMHGYWVRTQQLSEVKVDFSLGFEPDIEFKEHKVMESSLDKLNELKIMNDLGIFTPRQALIKLNPDASVELIDSMLQEISDYKAGIETTYQAQIASIVTEMPDKPKV